MLGEFGEEVDGFKQMEIFFIEDSNTVINTKSRMSPGEEISGEGSIEKISLDKELDDATPENLNHRLESG